MNHELQTHDSEKNFDDGKLTSSLFHLRPEKHSRMLVAKTYYF